MAASEEKVRIMSLSLHLEMALFIDVHRLYIRNGPYVEVITLEQSVMD